MATHAKYPTDLTDAEWKRIKRWQTLEPHDQEAHRSAAFIACQKIDLSKAEVQREDRDQRTRADGKEKREQQGKGPAKVEHLGSHNPRKVLEIPGLLAK